MKSQESRKSQLVKLIDSYSKMAQGHFSFSNKSKTVGVTAAAMATGGATLDAAIATVVSGISLNENENSITINLDGDGTTDFIIDDGAGVTFRFQPANANNLIYGFRNSGGSATYAKRFGSSVTINAGDGGAINNVIASNSAFRNGVGYLQYLGGVSYPGAYPNSQFDDGERGFVAVQFDIAGNQHLGYIDLEGTATGIIVNGWAYNDIAIGQVGGDSIVAQAVPEVSQVGGIALLCVGAIGISEMRRRREKVAPAKKS